MLRVGAPIITCECELLTLVSDCSFSVHMRVFDVGFGLMCLRGERKGPYRGPGRPRIRRIGRSSTVYALPISCKGKIEFSLSSYSFQLPGLTAVGGVEDVEQAGQVQVK